MLVWKHEATEEFSVRSGYKEEPEDSDHLLWLCCILRQLWRGLQVKEALVGCTSNPKDHFVNTFIAGDDNNRQMISISLWALW
ncbi:hypothetical protein V6Z11_A10G177600 [Gossypium hirsutum]